MKQTIIALLLTLGAVLTLVGSAFWISLFFEADVAPELAISFLGSGAWLLLIGMYLQWREERKNR